jgi:hypothetical protein
VIVGRVVLVVFRVVVGRVVVVWVALVLDVVVPGVGDAAVSLMTPARTSITVPGWTCRVPVSRTKLVLEGGLIRTVPLTG